MRTSEASELVISMSDYIVNWYLNDSPLPVISAELGDFLISSGKCDQTNCPNSIRTQKGPDPARALLVVPYEDLNNILPVQSNGQHSLQIVFDYEDSGRTDLELPYISKSAPIEFKNLYVTHVSEVIKHSENLAGQDLVLVELQDVRYHLNKRSGYDSIRRAAGTLTKDSVAQQIWEDEYSSFYSGKTLDVTNELNPEERVTAYLGQFSLDNFKNDWDIFNEACNRTENVFFIDLDGTPVIQKNSFSKDFPLFGLDRTFSEPIHGYLEDSMYSSTLSRNKLNNDDTEWETIDAYFWTSHSKSSFFKKSRATGSGNAIAGSTLNLFPLSMSLDINGNFKILKNYFSEVLITYTNEITNSKGLDELTVCYNGMIKVDFQSQISTLMYTNNPYGIFTLIDSRFRHGIPFFEWTGPFNDEFIPTLGGKCVGSIFPRGEGRASQLGFNTRGGDWHQKKREGTDLLFGATNFQLRGFYGNNPEFGLGKRQKGVISETGTNYPSIFGLNASGKPSVFRTGRYRISYHGNATLPLVGTPSEDGNYNQSNLQMVGWKPPGVSDPVQGEIGFKVGEEISLNIGTIVPVDIPIDATFPININIGLSHAAVVLGQWDERDITEFGQVRIHHWELVPNPNAPGYIARVYVGYGRTVYTEDQGNLGYNTFGTNVLQQNKIQVFVTANWQDAVPLTCRSAHFLGAREDFTVYTSAKGEFVELGKINFKDITLTSKFMVDTSSFYYDLTASNNNPDAERPPNWWRDNNPVSRFVNPPSNPLAKSQSNSTSTELQPTTMEYEYFTVPFCVSKIVEFNANDSIDLWVNAKSFTTSYHSDEESYSGIYPKQTNVVGQLKFNGKFSVEFISESSPTPQHFII